MVTLIEVLKNRIYGFWDLPFVKAAPDVSSDIIDVLDIDLLTLFIARAHVRTACAANGQSSPGNCLNSHPPLRMALMLDNAVLSSLEKRKE